MNFRLIRLAKNNHVENISIFLSDKFCSVHQFILRQDILDLMQQFTNVNVYASGMWDASCSLFLSLSVSPLPASLHLRLFFLLLIARLRVGDPVISSWLGQRGYRLAATGRCTTGLLRMDGAHMGVRTRRFALAFRHSHFLIDLLGSRAHFLRSISSLYLSSRPGPPRFILQKIQTQL